MFQTQELWITLAVVGLFLALLSSPLCPHRERVKLISKERTVWLCEGCGNISEISR